MNYQFEQWRHAVLPVDANIKQAVEILDKVALKIVLIIGNSQNLVGTVTDGDIRRGLLRDLDLNSPLIEVINKNPFVVHRELDREELLNLMTLNKVQQIPLLNNKNQLLGLYTWDEINTPLSRSHTIVIMAGGKGLRLSPHTLKCPKPLLPVAGKPILEHLIIRAKKQGFSNFLLAINYLGHMIEDHFEDGKKLGVNIQYLRESFPLGTAGALGLIKSKPSESFIVTNGDIISDINYLELINFHEQNNAIGTMAVRGYDLQNPFGVVKTQGIDIVSFEEKPITQTLINAGVYVLDPMVLEILSGLEYYDMSQLFLRLQSEQKRIVAFPIHEAWVELGNSKDLLSAPFNKELDLNG